MRNKIIFYLNGKRKEEGPDKASMMLADYLRYDQSLTGTKIVCAEGDCGACSVLRYFPHTPNKEFVAVNSCITLLAQLDGSSLVTVDALKKNNELHESQKAMVECHGSQCGFCTPGFVIALTGLVEDKLSKKELEIGIQEAKNCMTGNLCRCTGYQPIINAAVSMNLSNCESIKSRFYSESQDEDLKKTYEEALTIESEEFSFYAPKNLSDAAAYLEKNPETRIIASATDLGVVHNKRKIKLNRLLSLHLIPDLYKVEQVGEEIKFGARVTHTEFRQFMKDKLPEFSQYLDLFASPQIKNLGTIVGNIANASPIGDTAGPLLILNATVCTHGPKGAREIPLTQFFLAYKKTALDKSEIITHIKFRLPPKSSSLRFYKYSNRKDMDISAVNLALRIDWKDEAKKEILDVAMALGGVAGIPLRLTKTEDYLKGNFDLEGAIKMLHSEFNPLSDLRASSAYRHVLIENYVRKFFAEVQ